MLKKIPRKTPIDPKGKKLDKIEYDPKITVKNTSTGNEYELMHTKDAFDIFPDTRPVKVYFWANTGGKRSQLKLVQQIFMRSFLEYVGQIA